MAYDGVMDDVRRAIKLEKPKRLPVFACSEETDNRWYGKYSYEEMCQSGEKIAEVWGAAIQEFDYDWCWLQVDDCFEFEPLGVGTHGEGNILRATCQYLPATKQSLQKLRVPDPTKDGRMPEKLKAIRLLKQRFGDTVMLLGGCAGPYSSVALLFGLEESMMMGLSDPTLLAEACEFFVEVQSRYIKAQVQAGAHGVWLGDCNAFSKMLSLEQYRKFAFPACKKLVDKAHEAGAIIHLHNSEISVPHLLAEAELGVDIINCGPAANIAEVRKALTGKVCFSGNLDPIEVLMRGTPQKVAAEAKRIVKTCHSGGEGGYLFCTGEMTPRDVPDENMKAMIKAARQASSASR